MNFNEAINIIANIVSGIDTEKYDGLIVKRLEASNTLDENRTTNQTHIAISGEQMDFFPYIKADGYSNCEYIDRDEGLKKFFVLQIPFVIYPDNEKYLSGDVLSNDKLPSLGVLEGKEANGSVVRSRRKNQADQMQLSLITFDDSEFISFRKLLHAGDYLVLLKYKELLKYDCIGVKAKDSQSGQFQLSLLNNKFYKLQTKTKALTNKLIRVENKRINQEPLSLEELGKILGDWYNNPPTGNKSYTIHTFGIRYGKTILDNNYSTAEIIKQAGLKESFNIELNKSLNIYKNIESEKYGLSFYKDSEALSVRETPNTYYAQNGVEYSTGYSSTFARNRIIFGAPGTGKSFKLNEEKDELLKQGGEYERVTFHPDYSYANFVGTYKPVSSKDEDGKDSITYEYVPGPFMRVYVEALKNGKTANPKPYLLIIEEINRANVAAVFGDVFQLLDRANNVSEYPIMPSQDMKEYLAQPEVLGGSPADYSIIKIPDNMFIWATMNSADQGVFPMDTAFKRRWEFSYLGIDDAVEEMSGTIKNKKYTLGTGTNARLVKWNDIRNAINDALSSEVYNINEDKLLGPYFVSKTILENDDDEEFIKVFKNKVLMYLFDDAVKQKKKTFFGKCKDEIKGVRYSDLCNQFDIKGVFIFPEEVSKRFVEKPMTEEVVEAKEE